MKFLVVSLIFIATTEAIGIRPSQFIGVRGTLKCNGKPASKVLVKLYDHDSKTFYTIFGTFLAFTLDDKIAEGKTDSKGNYEISGTAHEVSRITPKLNIYHDCEDLLVNAFFKN